MHGEAEAEEDGEGDRETAVGGRLCNVARVALGVIHTKLRFIRGHKCFSIEIRSVVIKVNLRKFKLRERHYGKSRGGELLCRKIVASLSNFLGKK